MRVYFPKKHLFFREDARTILEALRKQKRAPETVYLDFSEVHFMSRSFTDELLNVVQELTAAAISVKFQNLNSSLQQMLRRVRQMKSEIQKAMIQ